MLRIKAAPSAADFPMIDKFVALNVHVTQLDLIRLKKTVVFY